MSQIPESAQPPAQPVSQTRPRLVDLAVLALLARCVFSVAAALAYYGDRAEITRQFATTYKSKNWTPDVLRHNVDTFLRSSVILALVMSVLVILLAALVRRGRNFARWAYLIFAFLFTGDLVRLRGFFDYHNFAVRTLTGLTGVAAVAALVLMFLPRSSAFFRPAGATSGGLLGGMFGPRSRAAQAPPSGAAAPRGGASRPPARPGRGSTAGSAAAGPAATGAPAAAGQPATRRPRAKSRRAAEADLDRS